MGEGAEQDEDTAEHTSQNIEIHVDLLLEDGTKWGGIERNKLPSDKELIQLVYDCACIHS